MALSQLQSGKTPWVDGLLTEFNSQYQELLAPRLTSLFEQFFSMGSRPDSMSEVVVALVLKPGKDPEECSSYRPISLINLDAKVFAKIVANRLSKVLEEIIHTDQTGFMSGKGTDINLQRLFLNLSVTHANSGQKVISLPRRRKGV